MRASTRHPTRPAGTLALHAAGACAVGAWAALLFTVACAPDLIGGPVGPPVADGPAAPPLVEPLPTPAHCEELRPVRETVREMTGIDPLCVEPEAQPLIWREHFAPRVGDACGCSTSLDP